MKVHSWHEPYKIKYFFVPRQIIMALIRIYPRIKIKLLRKCPRIAIIIIFHGKLPPNKYNYTKKTHFYINIFLKLWQQKKTKKHRGKPAAFFLYAVNFCYLLIPFIFLCLNDGYSCHIYHEYRPILLLLFVQDTKIFYSHLC